MIPTRAVSLALQSPHNKVTDAGNGQNIIPFDKTCNISRATYPHPHRLVKCDTVECTAWPCHQLQSQGSRCDGVEGESWLEEEGSRAGGDVEACGSLCDHQDEILEPGEPPQPFEHRYPQ